MRVLSLFDGMSCGQIALKEIGITPEVYYASEIDKFAIKQTQLNFPNTIQVGDVRDLNVEDLGHIDLILAGSPCTDMSFSGKRKGLSTVEGIEIKSLNEYLELKKQGFEFAGQSYLFWEFIRILNDVRKTNPDVLFLLENVKMGKKWEPVFDDAIGCKGNHNLKLVCPKCGTPHQPHSPHTMDADGFERSEIRTVMEDRGWCYECSFWQNLYDKHKDDPGWVRIDGVSWVLKPMVENVPSGWNSLGCGGRKMYINIEGKGIVTSNNCWCQGDVSDAFKDLMPDNATWATKEEFDKAPVVGHIIEGIGLVFTDRGGHEVNA